MPRPQNKRFYLFGVFRIDVSERVLFGEKGAISLTPKAFDTLLFLVENNNHTLGKQELIETIWPDSFVEENNLAVQVSALRKIFGETAKDSRFIVTVPGRGYRFVSPVEYENHEPEWASVIEFERSNGSAEHSGPEPSLRTLHPKRSSRKNYLFWSCLGVLLLGGLAIVIFTIIVRTLILPITVRSIKSMKAMQDVQPKIKELQKKYKGDRMKIQQETMALYQTYGVNPIAGCLPALLQIPVFLSLYWVLRNSDAQWISEFVTGLAVPLLLLAGLATFFSIRMSLRRQESQALRFLQYVAPAGLLVSGLVFPLPIGVVVYFLANNVWTLGQQHVLSGKLDREESAQPRRKS